MPGSRRLPALTGLAIVAMVLPLGRSLVVADTVVLKNGTIYRGTVDRDNALVYINDNLKRVIVYNSKIQKIEPDTGRSNFEYFSVNQPMSVHGGAMPKVAAFIQHSSWNDKGRRSFRYVNDRNKAVEMQQGITDFGPYISRVRGIDGFWVGQTATSTIPRPVVMSLLARVAQDDEKERKAVARWLIQAEWYPEAKQALDAIQKDFPASKETIIEVRRSVLESESREILKEVAIRRKALQPREVAARLRGLALEGLPKDVVEEVRDQTRKDEDQAAADRLLAGSLRDFAEKLPEADRKAWKVRLAEVLEGLAEAPDAGRPRLEAFIKAESTVAPEAKLAMALSGWVVGADAAVDSLPKAAELWRVRDIVADYLASKDEGARSVLLGDLSKVEGLDFGDVARVATFALPPLREHDREKEKPGRTKIHRVTNDANPVPTEYAVILPPEYHPLRSYPAIVALHDGRGPQAAIDWVAAEAARRGMIVIAPEYNLPDRKKGYYYSTAEHAAVELSLRDARKRYAIDSDRVALAGQLVGGDMAFDMGLAHPDLFSSVVTVSGMPANYALKYRAQAEKLPLYVVLGELAPVAREMVYDQFVRPMIENNQDVVYVDYLKRGLEELPEEVPAFVEWIDRRRREPYPRAVDAATAREGDARFFGIIAREIARNKLTAPDAADNFGQNIKPATIKMSMSTSANSIMLKTVGINRIDVWLSPKLVDFKKKIDIRINGTSIYKAIPPVDFTDLLEDIRSRGDRQQIYYVKVSYPSTRPRGR